MKGSLIRHAVVLLLLVCVWFAHAARLQDKDHCVLEGETLSVGRHTRQCLQITCHVDGKMSLLGCPLARCPEGRQMGYRDTDFSKPYPECCERPICAEE